MTEKEFQEKYGLTDDEVTKIKTACKIFKGKITRIEEAKDGIRRPELRTV